MDLSFLRQDGSNEPSHAQIQPRGAENYLTKHLLLYRYSALTLFSFCFHIKCIHILMIEVKLNSITDTLYEQKLWP